MRNFLRFIICTITIIAPAVLCVSTKTWGQETIPDRNSPPSLRAFSNPKPAVNASTSSGSASHNAELVKANTRIAELEEKNRRYKTSLQELQLERHQLLVSVQRLSRATGTNSNQANVLSSSIWPSRQIEVHWENPSPSNEQERQWVQDAITRTWDRHSGLRFTGWDTATPTSRGIRIRIADAHPHCKRLGKYLDGMVDGMVLNFTFNNWCPLCTNDRRGSIEKVAIHEFGHALGFAHEQNRSDAPAWCQNERQGQDGDWYITLYDESSIMNYCNTRWNNAGMLSASDVQAVQVLYGSPNQHAPELPKSMYMQAR